MSVEGFTSNGVHGPFVQYKSALRTKRGIFMTKRFKSSHAKLTGIVKSACRHPSSKWRLVGKVAYLDHNAKQMAKPKKQRRVMDIMALVTTNQKATAAGP